MSLSGEVRLGGRLFNCVNYDVITALNEQYIMKWMRRTELDKVLPAAEGEDDAAYMARLQAKLNDTLETSDLLAGYLMPAGKTERDFTLAMAAETAKYIAGVDDKESRDEIQRLGLVVVFDFFRAGIASLKHSRNVLDVTIPAMKNPKPTNAKATPSQEGRAVH